MMNEIKNQRNQADIGLIGLAVMGENLALNIESKGFTVSVYNRTISKVEEFARGRAAGKNILPCTNLKELIETLKSPRKILIMVKAGRAVDEVIEALAPMLQQGDIIIDGGNSYFEDTIKRTRCLEEKGLLFCGVGISGGEEGALHGPSMMPGGSTEAWSCLRPIFEAICAKADDGEPCCRWIGGNGAGHFVKMVHNGIEYGDMQVICEAYQLMRDGLSMSADEMHDVFSRWNDGELNSYLIEITADILEHRSERNELVLEKILDVAGQKGTGKWTVITALNEGIPLTLIAEAVFSRSLSALKAERTKASEIYPHSAPDYPADKDRLVDDIEKALYCSKIISYAQGYTLMRAASLNYGWKLNYEDIASIWRGGCIIRSRLLTDISHAFRINPGLNNLLLDKCFEIKVKKLLPAFRRVIGYAVLNGIPVPAFAAALEYFDSYTSEKSAANLLQAQRDYFGAHTYERVDAPRGVFFHTNWTGHGGKTSASTYLA